MKSRLTPIIGNMDRSIKCSAFKARRALEQLEGSAHDALAQTDDEEYEIQTRKLSL
jgi:hypothetical protein